MNELRRALERNVARAGRRVRRTLASERDRRVADWVAAGYDKTLRLDYDLGPSSVVLDAGGFEGQWASDVYARFRCRVHVFEPVREFAERIEERFARNPDITVHRVGLAGADGEGEIALHGVGSSLVADARPWAVSAARERVRLVRAADFFAEHGLDRVDLLKVNIEGGEYELLEHLIESGLVSRIANIQVQFHDFVPDADRRRRELRAALRRTHEPTYEVEWVWESWALKASP
jgi:FkbM family methyltransferase